MYNYYLELLEDKTRNLDLRIKDTDLYELSRKVFINKNTSICNCVVYSPDLIIFKYKLYKSNKYDIKYEVLYKNVIQMKDDYCLTYSEARTFNTKHKLVNLEINTEFLLTEKINISAVKNNYGIILNASHHSYSEIEDAYYSVAHIPSVGVTDYYSIPYGEIFYGAYPETIQMFEDYYSGVSYNKNFIK